ncbi:MAG: glycosyltransferase, partial [Anaerolineales bacterium]
MGLDAAVRLAQGLARLIRAERQVELVVVGRVPEGLQRQTEEQASIPIRWEGVVEHRHIPEVDRSAHILYAADINAACPNSVIEALACGLPVVAFDTGALPEMVTAGAGQLVPYGGDPWKL